MYTRLFFSKFPVVKPVTTRAQPRALQHEEGLPRQSSDVDSDEEANTSTPVHKRRKTAGPYITIHGLESLTSAFQLTVQDREEKRGAEFSDIKRSECEAVDALGRVLTTLMNSLSHARAMLQSATTDEYKVLSQAIIYNVSQRLKDGLSYVLRAPSIIFCGLFPMSLSFLALRHLYPFSHSSLGLSVRS